MKNKSFSIKAPANLIIILAIFVSVKCAAQIETVRGPITQPPHGIKWNQSAYFATAPKLKTLDWSTYEKTVDGKQITTWALFAGAGVAFGMREAYHADPTVFETRWGVGRKSFWGSEAWQRNYVGNTYPGRHKSELFGNVGLDFWHTAGATSKAFMFTATFSIAIRKQPMKYRIANAVIGYGIQSLFSSLTYNILR